MPDISQLIYMNNNQDLRHRNIFFCDLIEYKTISPFMNNKIIQYFIIISSFYCTQVIL